MGRNPEPCRHITRTPLPGSQQLAAPPEARIKDGKGIAAIRPNTGFRRAWILGAFALAIVAATASAARAQQPDELKAGFVINFLKFTDWPAHAKTDTNAPITLAIIAPPGLTETFTTSLAGIRVQGHNLQVRSISTNQAATHDFPDCHAIFLAPEAMIVWPDIRTNLAKRPILTISDAPRFCEAGGMLNLKEKDNRLRFTANPTAATRTGLKLRSELLKLASIVQTEKETP